MPRRNLVIVAVAVFAGLLCNARAQNGRYGVLLADAMALIRGKFIRDFDRRELFDAAMHGMVSHLADKNTNYLDVGEYRRFREGIDTEFVGIGVQLDSQAKELTVQFPLIDGPADKAGIRARDRILRIDGAVTAQMSREQAVKRLKLENGAGVPVDLEVLHDGEASPVAVTVTRDLVRQDSVIGYSRREDRTWEYFIDRQPSIKYVRLTGFSKHSVEDLDRVLDQLEREGMKALILDLRDNPGGLLEGSVDICDMFVENGKEVVSVRDGRGRRHVSHSTTARRKHLGFPMVVLVNQATASASEIVAACLQDHGRAVVAGQQSFGKGTVQTLIDLEPGRSALKLTTATYWRPSGQNINRTPENEKNPSEWGVRPDPGLVAEMNEDQERVADQARLDRDRAGRKPAKSPPTPTAVGVDPQVDKAVQWLRSGLEAGGRSKSAIWFDSFSSTFPRTPLDTPP